MTHISTVRQRRSCRLALFKMIINMMQNLAGVLVKATSSRFKGRIPPNVARIYNRVSNFEHRRT